jgi:nicotinate-nucleotide adenylyltransferase
VRIGILGGTFNPPHLGHLICAQEAYLQLGLGRVTLIPARIPPHKPVEDEPGAEHRLELCRLAIRGDEQRFEVSDLEIHREGPSYTVDTLEELHSSAPDHELFLIVGGDIAAGLPNWHRPEQVLSLATLAVAERRGTPRAAVDEALATLPGGERTCFFRMPRIAISSTMLRERVRCGQPIRYYVPEALERYINGHRLYAGVGSVT